MSDSYLVIELNHQPVELCKLLKIADLVSGGGEAKIVISEGHVLLNGEVEYQKRKKIYHEDVIEFNGEVVQLVVNEDLAEAVPETVEYVPEVATVEKSQAAKKSQPKSKPKSKKKAAKQPKIDSTFDSSKAVDTQESGPKKRRPISF